MHVLRKGTTAAPEQPKAKRKPRAAATPPVNVQVAQQSAPADSLDSLVQAGPLDVIGLMLWKARHTNPDLQVKITPADIDGMQACTEYLEIRPQVRIQRPPGAPAMPALPATATRSERPAVPAEGPRPYVLVQLLDQNGNAFVPVENNEADNDKRVQAARLRAAIEKAPSLAGRIANAARTNDFVASDCEEAAQVLRQLAQALA